MGPGDRLEPARHLDVQVFVPQVNTTEASIRDLSSHIVTFRFCSQPYKVEDFHESIHLCNNAIQQKYKNGERSSALPEENMWDNDTFISYLRQVRGERREEV